MPAILDIIKSRRSIRQYTGQPVTEEILRMLLEAAMAAPTACNSQPWEFVVTNDPEMMERFRSTMRFGNYNAPAAITVCGNEKIALNSCAKHYWVQDCSAAVENILIAAAGLGLGTVWLGVYPMEPNIKRVAQLLNLPDNVVPLGVVYVGYPAEEKQPRTQYQEQRVHWHQYEPRKRRLKPKNAKYLE